MSLSSISQSTTSQIESLVQEKKEKMGDVALVMILALLLENLEQHLGVKGHHDVDQMTKASSDLAPKVKFKDGKMILITHEKGKKIETEIKKIDDQHLSIVTHITGKTADGKKIDLTVTQDIIRNRDCIAPTQSVQYYQFVQGSIGDVKFAGNVAEDYAFWRPDAQGNPIPGSVKAGSYGNSDAYFNSIPGFKDLHLDRLLVIPNPNNPGSLTQIGSDFGKFITKAVVNYSDRVIEKNAKKEIKNPFERLLLEFLLESKVKQDSKEWEKKLHDKVLQPTA